MITLLATLCHMATVSPGVPAIEFCQEQVVARAESDEATCYIMAQQLIAPRLLPGYTRQGNPVHQGRRAPEEFDMTSAAALDKEHTRLLQQGWRLDADGCYRKPAEREACDHHATFSFGCTPGVTRCNKCGKLFGVLDINAEVLA